MTRVHVMVEGQSEESFVREVLNDGSHTAPSKRLIAALSGYQKVIHGPLVAIDIGLETIKRSCPHFHEWFLRVDKLADPD